MGRSRAKNETGRRGGRHRLGRPAPGLEWIVVCEPGSGGRHRTHVGAGSGALAAGVVLVATSAAAASTTSSAGPAGTPAAPRPAGEDRPVLADQRDWPWADDTTPPHPWVDPVTEPGAVDANLSTMDGPGAGPMIPAVFTGDIPTTVLDAYRRARDTINRAQPGCHLPLELLAAIGKVETGHARSGQVDTRGTTVRPILGPVLDGNGFAAIGDTDGGTLDGDTRWDRAVGPMQFIPGTWRRWAADGNSDGRADPHNVYDAALAAARYLCAANRDLGTPDGLDAAILSYNHSTSYRNLVLRWMATYASGTVVVPDAVPVVIPDPTTVPAGTTAPAPVSTPTTPITTTPTTAPTTEPPTSTPPSTDPTTDPNTTVPPDTSTPETPPASEPASEPPAPTGTTETTTESAPLEPVTTTAATAPAPGTESVAPPVTTTAAAG